MGSVFALVLSLGVIEKEIASFKNNHDPITINLLRVVSYRKISRHTQLRCADKADSIAAPGAKAATGDGKFGERVLVVASEPRQCRQCPAAQSRW
jgi:hypothetical protein